MKEKAPYQEWKKKVEILYEEFRDEYLQKIEKANDTSKFKVHMKYLQKSVYEKIDQIHRNMKENSRFFIEIEHEMEEDKYKEFQLLFNEKYSGLKKSEKTGLMKNLVVLEACKKIIPFILNEGKIFYATESNNNIRGSSQIFWKGKTELDFIQLIYSLKEAGYLENNENQITTLIKQVASVFNYELSEHWQSNHSDNINNRNTDYRPKIFDKILNAYTLYRERQIDTNKKKKPK